MSLPSQKHQDERRTGVDDKRRAILDAALVLFAERGFYGTAVPLVAERAKVGAGTIYRYFPSKEALVNSLYVLHKSAFRDALLLEFPLRASFRMQLATFWRRACKHFREHPIAFQFLELHHHGAYLDDHSRKVEAELLGAAKAIVQLGIDNGELRKQPPEILMAVVWGTFRAFVQGGCEQLLPFDDDTIAAAEDCVWDAIAARS